MKLKLILVAAAMTVGTVAYADTLNTTPLAFNTSTGQFSAFLQGTRGTCPGGVCTDGVPFWNNTSGDNVVSVGTPGGSTSANVGDFLSAGGAFGTGAVAGCSTCGVNYMASGGQMYTQAANSPNFATAFSFIRNAASLSITLLYANSSTNNNAEFGIYQADSGGQALANHVIIQQGGVTNLNSLIGTTYNVSTPGAWTTWGVYARTCDANATTGACPSGNIITLFSNQAMNTFSNAGTQDAPHMHWALFQSGTNAAVYYMALEDGVFTGTQTRNPTEGYGDYNDIIIKIDTSGVSSVPEPATLSIVGLGLVGLGILGRRKLKK